MWTLPVSFHVSFLSTSCPFWILEVFVDVHRFVGSGNICLSLIRSGCPNVLNLVGFYHLCQHLLNKGCGKDIIWNVLKDYSMFDQR